MRSQLRTRVDWQIKKPAIGKFALLCHQRNQSNEPPRLFRHGIFQPWPCQEKENGVALYPELMAELDAIKRERIGGLMLCRDWGERGPWPTWPKPDQPDFTHLSRKVKEVIRAADLRDELSFTSFRRGGFTEGGDAELTDREMLAQGRHTTVKVLPKYTKRTTRQVMNGAKKRRASRTKGD
jgi:hypothetical protein